MESIVTKLKQFLKTKEFVLKELPGGASARQYFKLTLRIPSYFPGNPVLLMTVRPEEIQTLEDYFNIDYYLKRKGIPTPRVYEIHRRHGWIFMEYNPRPTVERYLSSHPEERESVMRRMIDFLLKMQKACDPESHCPAFQRRFDQKKFRFEFRFHLTEQLIQRYFGYHLSGSEQRALDKMAEEISSRLDTNQDVFVHRDFQSSNLFITESSGDYSFQLIDFQDARTGTAVYDLVSCLWDSYLPLSPDKRQRLLHYYLKNKEAFLPAGTELLIDFAVIQRKLHDAGAFAYNFHRFNSRRYLQFISGALNSALEVMKKYPQFKEFTMVLHRIIKAAKEKNRLP